MEFCVVYSSGSLELEVAIVKVLKLFGVGSIVFHVASGELCQLEFFDEALQGDEAEVGLEDFGVVHQVKNESNEK